MYSIVPMQDLLLLRDEGRMNIPSTLGNNWGWRMERESLKDEIAQKLVGITEKYKR